MKRRREGANVLSLAFLDVITCGFGAILLLLIVTKPAPVEIEADSGSAQIAAMVRETIQAIASLQSLWENLTKFQSDQSELAGPGESAMDSLNESIKSAEQTLKGLEGQNRGLEIAKQSLQRASIRPTTASRERSIEVGGIPVDSEYVIFVIDTSGSMKEIWRQVVDVMNRLLDIHPEVKGFQVMNDNGAYLYESTRRQWLPDIPRSRRQIRSSLESWSSFSNSSPVEGIERALKTYSSRYENIAIYVLGDEFTGASYERVLDSVARLNHDAQTGTARVRVHGIGFVSNYLTGQYATLMRALTERNRGTFLALPLQ